MPPGNPVGTDNQGSPDNHRLLIPLFRALIHCGVLDLHKSPQLPRAPQGSPGLPQGSPGLPQGSPGIPRASQGLPRAPQGSLELLKIPQSSRGLPGALRIPWYNSHVAAQYPLAKNWILNPKTLMCLLLGHSWVNLGARAALNPKRE